MNEQNSKCAWCGASDRLTRAAEIATAIKVEGSVSLGGRRLTAEQLADLIDYIEFAIRTHYSYGWSDDGSRVSSFLRKDHPALADVMERAFIAAGATAEDIAIYRAEFCSGNSKKEDAA